MKIASFLPSATEILFAIGAGGDVCGVTFECDFPEAAGRRAVVVHSLMQAGLTPLEIDTVVRETAHAGGSLYCVDWERLQALTPDLVIAQDLCRVCAIDTPRLARELSELPRAPEVLSLEPHGLGDVFDDILRVGAAVGRDVEAKELVAALQARVERVRVAAAHDDRGRLDGHRPRVLCLEWLEPLYQGGHWVPEMVELAGGEPVLATAGGKSVRLAWEDVLAADPEVVVLMPCGYHLRETVEQYEALRGDFPAGWRNATAMRQGRIYAVDGSAYFSRPGPRLVEGLEILRTIIAGGDLEGLPAASVLRVAGSSLR